MKIKITLILLCLTTLDISTQDKAVSQKQEESTFQNPPSNYQLYVWWKEMFYTIFVLIFWLDYQKAHNAKIYCNTCEHSMHSIETYGYLMSKGDTESIAKLKKLWRTKSSAIIAQFLEEIQNKHQIECVKCLAFNGWHCQSNNEETTQTSFVDAEQ